MVNCEGGFEFRHAKGNIKAQTGSYARAQELATAVGNVVARDSSGEGAYFGERLLYDRRKKIMTLPEKPLLHQYQRNSKGQIDTLAISARHIVYDQIRQTAVATQEVRIVRDDMVVTCDTGVYDRGKGILTLRGHPRCTLKGYVLTGDSMHIALEGENLKTVLVVRNAHGSQDEDQGEGKPRQHSEVQGDTLFVEFAQKKAKRLYVNNSAKGLFYESDLADFINRMSGDRLDIEFDDGKMRMAKVQGDARSSYYYATKERKVEGLNEAAGDTIHITFDSIQVKRLKVAGNLATGIYYDLTKKGGKKKGGKQSIGQGPDARPPETAPAGQDEGKARDRAQRLKEKMEEAKRKKGL
jgi:lipopolysaccharide export system protein LptA